MTRLLAIVLAALLLLAGCAPEPSHQPTIYGWQTTIDQGWVQP